MSNQTSTAAKQDKKAHVPKYDIMVLELIDKRQSSWVLDGSVETGLPQYLDSPVEKRILNQSVELDTREVDENGNKVQPGSYRKLRYLSGCNTPYVDEQERMGYISDEKGRVPNRAPGIDDIWIKNGAITVINSGNSIPAYNYLKRCSLNADALNLPDGATPILRELKQAQKAEDALKILDARQDATNIVRTMYSREGDKYVYNESKIDYLCSLFGVIPLESYEEKVWALSEFAQQYPQKFMNTVADANAEARQDIMEAVHFGVINIQGDQAAFVNSKRTFFKFVANAKSVEARINEMVEYCMSPKGATDYKQIKIETGAAKEMSLEIKN